MIQWNKDDLFYVCTMIEYVSRKTHNKSKDVVVRMSDKALAHQLKAAGINHCLSFEQVADEWIEDYGIPNGNYDNISKCRYEVPTVTAIGRVYQTLISEVASLYQDIVEAIKMVYSSFISDEILIIIPVYITVIQTILDVLMRQENYWTKKIVL